MYEQEAVKNLKELTELRKNKRGDIKHDTCICGTKDLDIVLQLLEEKENKINDLEDETYKMSEYMKEIAIKRNKAIDKLKEVKSDFLDFCPDCVDLAGELLDILEEKNDRNKV